MPDFWPSCGYRLLCTGADGRLAITDNFLRSQLLRPELAPLPGSSSAEMALHDTLLANPLRAVTGAEINAIVDPDARDNYGDWLRFRARLVAADSLEGAYLGIFRGEGIDLPALFVHRLTQLMLRHILGSDADPHEARAAELLFRTQRILTTPNGVVAVDDATHHARGQTAGLVMPGESRGRGTTSMSATTFELLAADNAGAYWQRDERHDFAMSLESGSPAIDALSRVLCKWIGHFLAVDVRIAQVPTLDRERWVWHVGLDAEGSALLNDLYNEGEIDDERMARLLGLFRLDFVQLADMRPALAGRPVYLAMAMDNERRLRLKPQNILLNLPLARQQ